MLGKGNSYKKSPLDHISNDSPQVLKGIHTVYFSISYYNVNQKPAAPRIDFHCETQEFGMFMLF